MEEKRKGQTNSNAKKNIKQVGKYKIDSQRLSISLGVLAIIIAIIAIAISGRKVALTDSTNRSELNAKKYAKELLSEYNTEGMKEKFLTDYNDVQSNVGLYILNNSTMEQDSFSNIMKVVQEVLPKEDWSKLSMNRPTEWNGTWSTDENGNVRFQFAQKEIEPSWTADTDVSSKIILN